MADYDKAMGLLSGLQRGIGSYFDATKAREALDYQREKDAAAKEQQGLLNQIAMKKSGLIQTDNGLEYDPEWFAMQKELALAKKPTFGLPQLTKGQEAADVAFGKAYADYQAGGGSAGLKKNISQLEDVKKGLGETDYATGPIVGLIPKTIRDITPGLSKGAALQDKIEQVIQQSLRQTLGAQFTEKEAARLIERAYNPRLSEQENIERVQTVLDELETMRKSRDAAGEYFRKYGTIAGHSTPHGLLSPQSANAGQAQMSGEDMQAMEWARQNPNDPRAQEIMKRLGQ